MPAIRPSHLQRPRPCRSCAHARGFTLIEVMIALFVLAVMAGMAWQGVDMVVRSRDAARNRTEAILRLQSVMAQWEADLRAMVSTDAMPGFEAQGNALRLTRRTEQGVRVVAWTLRGGSWYRWASAPSTMVEPLQEAWLGSYQLLGNEAGTLRALGGVADVQLYTFQGGAWSNAQSTGELSADGGTVQVGGEAPAAGSPATTASANTTAKMALPDGVRLQISFRAGALQPDSTANPGAGASTVEGAAEVTGGAGTITRTLRLVHP